MRLLFVGDVFGSPGRRVVREHLPSVIEERQVDLVVVNAENSAGGFGLTPPIAEELFELPELRHAGMSAPEAVGSAQA